ncbi:heme-binding protein [Saccharibacter floricola]|uniref:heme-binding protein n=1 Tax=Saccharibacter floricola TaxID=231053 RepID=UPI00035D6878|nr:heme-binding protein [Saccharibacter floricola]
MTLSLLLADAQKTLDGFSRHYCCAVLNSEGRLLLWFRSDEITPCSEKLSTQKAYTAFSFQADTDKLAEQLGASGLAAMTSPDYCFLPGGAVGRTVDGKTAYYVGVSMENPEIDQPAAHAVMNAVSSYF